MEEDKYSETAVTSAPTLPCHLFQRKIELQLPTICTLKTIIFYGITLFCVFNAGPCIFWALAVSQTHKHLSHLKQGNTGFTCLIHYLHCSFLIGKADPSAFLSPPMP